MCIYTHTCTCMWIFSASVYGENGKCDLCVCVTIMLHVWFGVWGGGMVWCVGRCYGLVCGEVVWFGVWGRGMVWCVGRWYGLVCGEVCDKTNKIVYTTCTYM